MVARENVAVNLKTRLWLVAVVLVVATVVEVASLNGPNVCMVKQKYNITKRIKYRAPMTVRTYEWCFSMPPKCSKYKTEMRDLTRLETEERTAEVAVCCPGYKMKDVSCVSICPSGKTGSGCSEECPPNKWGPNCVNDCKACSDHGTCSPTTGECICQDGWQGESCTTSMSTITTRTTKVEELLTTKPTIKIATSTIPSDATTIKASIIETTTTAVISSPTINTVLTTSKISTTTLNSTTTKILNTFPSIVATEKDIVKSNPVTASTIYEKETNVNNIVSTTLGDMETSKPLIEKSTRKVMISNYNRTETPLESNNTFSEMTVETKTETTVNVRTKPSTVLIVTDPVNLTIFMTSSKEIPKEETTKNPEVALKGFPTTLKFKPKEIWIKPAQKGETSFVESKVKPTYELAHPRYRSATNKVFSQNTTPKTIIVSIIPTSVSYATFKKIALTTASFLSQKINATKSFNKFTEQGFTKAMSVSTFAPPSATAKFNTSNLNSSIPSLVHYVTQHILSSTSVTAKTSKMIKTNTFTNNRTNGTLSTTVTPLVNSSIYLTTTVSLTNEQIHIQKQNTSENTTTITKISTRIEKITKIPNQIIKGIHNNETKLADKITNIPVRTTKTNLTDITKINEVTTQDPSDEEAFHILTEPEHITAVMGEKGTERSSVDLVSVISIAGGVMMSIITVAVIIVMIERCKKHSYEDVRKISDVRMQVLMDDELPPPPYVRSIFHTPLPDPPTTEKCHYQPISTLDRNLKQFMRPVVVQTISPIMLENFRGILECHYDHLPRRSHDFGNMPLRCSATPSIDNTDELHHIRACSVTDSAIEALKCEARLDVIDSTTSEPLYAEIPCWRPPSEHAIETINLNGEAVTEL